MLLVLLQLGACSDTGSSAGAAATIDNFKLSWSQLADGSSFARTHPDEDGSTEALRCWPAGEAGFDCLEFSTYQGGPLRIRTLARTQRDELPHYGFPAVGAGDGYSCGTLLGPREIISRGGDDLTSNDLDERRRWTRGFVQNYMADNHVEGAAWFPCLEILDELLKGSTATLGTTSITKNDLDA